MADLGEVVKSDVDIMREMRFDLSRTPNLLGRLLDAMDQETLRESSLIASDLTDDITHKVSLLQGIAIHAEMIRRRSAVGPTMDEELAALTPHLGPLTTTAQTGHLETDGLAVD